MARASIYTLLSLDSYAKIMGINPVAFNQAQTPSLNPQVFPTEGCGTVWYQTDFQNFDQVSREQLAQEIAQAEQEIANVIGYWPAPVWIAQEDHAYTRPYLREAYGNGIDVRGNLKAVATTYGRIIAAGQRAVALIGTASTAGLNMVYSDVDGDGFFETVTLVLPTTYTDKTKIKVYFASHDGEQEWEIRPPRSIRFVGADVVIEFDAWLFIDPDLWDAYPTSNGMAAIDVSTVSKYVTSAEVYYEFTDFAQPSAKFYYEPYPCPLCGSTDNECTVCQNSSQCGCFHVRDHKNGLVVPVPGTYSNTNAAWSSEGFDASREPDIVKLWYKAGDMGNEYKRGVALDPLSNAWAKVIAYMATARLERPLCGCNNVIALSEYLRTDLSVTNQGGTSYTIDFADLSNPFGTRRGELYCWRFIQKRLPDGRRLGVAVI
jgi:hypothetical protein